ncbi:MAG: hypothetical protein MUE42_12845 [Opitutaceae bacterium]|nr:hypothetical protein [Opitutaceae bacterium]
MPDAAAKESAALVTNPRTCVIDASTAHRVAEGWTYGVPELGAAYRAATPRPLPSRCARWCSAGWCRATSRSRVSR